MPDQFHVVLSDAFDGCHEHFAPGTIESLRALYDRGMENGRLSAQTVEGQVRAYEDLQVGHVIRNSWLKLHGQMRQVTRVEGDSDKRLVTTRILDEQGAVLKSDFPFARSRFLKHSPYWYVST